MSSQSKNEMIAQKVRDVLSGAESGHDWWHVYRVWRLSRKIAGIEGVSLEIVEPAALLHDIADAKFHHGNEQIGQDMARKILTELEVPENIIERVVAVVRDISFKSSLERAIIRTPELDVVQDADRLDAIGAIGIARTFNYGGYKGNGLYDPDIPPRTTMTRDEYLNEKSTTINHFYEKLLLLKDRMNTNTGRKMAASRHEYMQNYLNQFMEEWEGEA